MQSFRVATYFKEVVAMPLRGTLRRLFVVSPIKLSLIISDGKPFVMYEFCPIFYAKRKGVALKWLLFF